MMIRVCFIRKIGFLGFSWFKRESEDKIVPGKGAISDLTPATIK